MDAKEEGLIDRCRGIHNLLAKSGGIARRIIGDPPAGPDKDPEQPTTSLDELANELRVIHIRANVLYEQLARIEDQIGKRGSDETEDGFRWG